MMAFIGLLVVMLIVFWGVGALAYMIIKKKKGGCIGCSGGNCGSCAGKTDTKTTGSKKA